MLRLRHDVQRLGPRRLRTLATALVATLAAAWFYLGSLSISLAITESALSAPALATLGVLAAVNLLLLAGASVATYQIPQSPPLRFWFVVVVLLANAIVSFTDQVGAADILYAIASMITLAVVFRLRSVSAESSPG